MNFYGSEVGHRHESREIRTTREVTELFLASDKRNPDVVGYVFINGKEIKVTIDDFSPSPVTMTFLESRKDLMQAEGLWADPFLMVEVGYWDLEDPTLTTVSLLDEKPQEGN